MKIIDTERQWAAVCTDCPAVPGDDRKTWEFPGTDEGKDHAEAFAKRHASLQGHTVDVCEQYTVTANRWEDGLAYTRVPDVGDATAGIGKKVTLPTIFPGRPAVYFLATCQTCVGVHIPFGTEGDRDLWADGHHKSTGHDVTPSVEVRPDEGDCAP